MNPFRNSAGNLNEILFENRNQNYGAYTIRKSYNTTVFKSIAITASVFIFGFWGVSLLVNTEVEVPTDTGTNIPTEITTIFDGTTKPKVKIAISKPPASAPSKPVANTSLGTIIKDSTEKTVNTNLINPESTGTNSLNVTGTTPGTGTFTTNVEPTTNTLMVGSDGIEMAPDVLPSMPNWSRILSENLSYPNEARAKGISGKVVVNFIIDEEGKIIQTKILKHVGGGCDEEALRVIKLMPKWKPGIMQGKPVKVSFNQVITFQMQ